MKSAGEKTPLKSRVLGFKHAVTRHLPRWFERPLHIVYEHGLTTAWSIRWWIKNRRSRSPLTYEERINEEIADGVQKFQSHREGAPLYEPAPPSWDYVEAATRQLIRERTGFAQWEYVVHQANQIEAPQILSLGTGSCGIEIGLAEGMTTSYRHWHSETCCAIHGNGDAMGRAPAKWNMARAWDVPASHCYLPMAKSLPSLRR